MISDTPRNIFPLPCDVLSPAELQACWDFRTKYGGMAWTREPGADPKTGLDRVLLRRNWERVPLIEIGGQRCYAWLQFLAWRRDHEGLAP